MFFVLLLLATASAYPSGAPPNACQTMLPIHGGGIPPQTTPSPFAVSARRNGANYMITIQSPATIPFAGFMIQARGPGGETVGSFEPTASHIHTLDCSHPGDTLTHSNTDNKPTVEVPWNSNGYEGPVFFNATVAQNYATFWSGVESPQVQITKGSGNDAPLQSTRPTSTTPPNYVPESKQEASTEFDPFYVGCDVKKACFGAPVNCVKTKNCQAVVAVSVYGDRYEFEMKAAPSAAWVGVGLSRDAQMGDDSVIECVKDGSNVKSYISTTATRPTTDVARDRNQNNIQLLQSSVTDGWMYCRVLREPRITNNGVTWDLAGEMYHLLIASGGSVHPNKVGFHTEQYLASGEKKFLSDVSAIQAASKLLLRLHGAFMIAAWLGTASIGIILARYYKQVWPGKQICGKDIWFVWHRFLMVLTWCLTIAAFILIWLELRTWSGANNPHAILGTITTILCFIQPIGAMFRPHPGTKNRPLFNWLHWLIGNTAQIVGIVAIFFAVTLNKAELPEWVYWILVGFVVFHALMHLIFSGMTHAADKSAERRINSFPMKEMGGSGRSSMYNDRNPDAPFSTTRKCLLALYMIINILIVAALIVIAVLAPIDEYIQKIRDSM